MTPLLYIINFS